MMGVELLPAGYRRLNYIKNPSNAYINTGIAPTSNTGVEVKFSIPPNNKNYNVVFGCRENSGNTRFFMYVDWNSSPKAIVFGYNSNIDFGSRPRITNSDIGKVCIASMNKYNDKSYYYNGIKVGTTPSTLASITRPIFLFAQNAYNGIISQYNGEIYYVLVTEGTNKIAFYVPAERLSDNKVGVYDIISKQFLTSPNGTDFIGGSKWLIIRYLQGCLCCSSEERRAA